MISKVHSAIQCGMHMLQLEVYWYQILLIPVLVMKQMQRLHWYVSNTHPGVAVDTFSISDEDLNDNHTFEITRGTKNMEVTTLLARWLESWLKIQWMCQVFIVGIFCITDKYT